MRRLFATLAALAAIAAAACDASPTASEQELLLGDAFAAALVGYDNALSSFGAAAGMGAWAPGELGRAFAGRGAGLAGPGGPGERDRAGGARGPGGPGGHGDRHGGGMMGGGLGGPFVGGLGGFGRGAFGDGTAGAACTSEAASGRLECETVERGGLTIERSVAYADAAGGVQSAFDETTTNTIDTRVAVSGTIEHRRGNATSSVRHDSDRTVSGLAAGSTRRTLNGASAGTENTTGATDDGAFTVARVMGDTTQNVVLPVDAVGTLGYPIAGTIIRAMRVTLTREGQAPVTSSRREVITYDGSDSATVVITRDGETRTCTMPLPRGRPTCG